MLSNTLYERPSIARGEDGYFHPSNEEEIVALIKRARREGRQLRVRGSAHSVAAAIRTDAPGQHIDVMLDRYRAITFDDARRRVTVQAGCNLGDDPRDPTRTASWESSLLAKLEARGWALPDLGGVTHQTVAGFLMTGSCGGTVAHAFEDAVVGFRFIDGSGRVHDVERGDDHFDAITSSLGLLGVISTVTFECIPHYDILGREDVTAESSCTYDLFGDGDVGLEGFLRRTEYARLMWWPQHGVRRVVTWQAQRMRDSDYDAATGPRGALQRKPYRAVGYSIRDPRIGQLLNLAGQAAGGLIYDALANTSRAFEPLARRSPMVERMGRRVRTSFATHVLPPVLRQFVETTDEPQRFWDTWCHGLPMDNQMSEASLPTEFTEIWVPLDRAGDVMRTMRAHYDRAGYDATGSFICEVYAARAARAWMHPGYGRDSLRIDLFWFARNPGDPTRGWFVQFWELLRPFAYRLHWGKYLPRDPELGAHHLRRQLPRWDDFLALRARCDPGNLFLTRYWREALGLS